jgi:hypothetical protein
MDLKDKLVEVQVNQSHARDLQLIQEILAEMPKVKKELEQLQNELSSSPTLDQGPLASSVQRMLPGVTKYTKIPVPILAIYAYPRDTSQIKDPKWKKALLDSDKEYTGRQADDFEKGVPTARVVRIANADHAIFRSNEADVIREMNAFLSGLK